jgi:hypothetical protein
MIASIGVLPSGFVLASTYSSSSYDQSVYGGTAPSAPPSIQIGPITLSDTGSTCLSLGDAGLFASGTGPFVGLRQRRRQSQQNIG